MEHRKYKDLIQLFVFGELSKEEKKLFESHIVSCIECRTEMEEQMKLKSLFSKGILIEPDDHLLNEARTELHAAIRKERSKISFWEKLTNASLNMFSFNYKIALGSVALVILGFLSGYLIFHNPGQEKLILPVTEKENYSFLSSNNDVLPENKVKISNVTFIDQDLKDDQIEFTFDAIKPVHMKGSINDPGIQNILLYSMLNAQNPGVRLNSINAISTNQPGKLDSDIKEALISSVKYDDNPGVRREALKLLNKYPYDEEIKKALLFVLMNDENSGLRIEAINGLVEARKEGYSFSEQDLSIFKKRVEMDKNNYVKYQAKTVLKENY